MVFEESCPRGVRYNGHRRRTLNGRESGPMYRPLRHFTKMKVAGNMNTRGKRSATTYIDDPDIEASTKYLKTLEAQIDYEFFLPSNLNSRLIREAYMYVFWSYFNPQHDQYDPVIEYYDKTRKKTWYTTTNLDFDTHGRAMLKGST